MILFLDFDGVLHPEPCYDEAQLFCRLPMLEELLRGFPEVSIVVSSTWRDTHTLEELRAIFSPDIGSRVVDVTPSWREWPDLFERIGYQRHAEVEGWLRQTGIPWEKWVALDDKHWLYKPFLENLVRCNKDIGIDETTLQRLSEKFKMGKL